MAKSEKTKGVVDSVGRRIQKAIAEFENKFPGPYPESSRAWLAHKELSGTAHYLRFLLEEGK